MSDANKALRQEAKDTEAKKEALKERLKQMKAQRVSWCYGAKFFILEGFDRVVALHLDSPLTLISACLS